MVNVDDKTFGFEKVNKLFEKIKEALKRIASIENNIENPSVVVSEDEDYNTYDEMEAVIEAEIDAHKKLKKPLIFFKWVLIIFESFGAYLAFGLVMHTLNLNSLIAEKWQWIIILFQFLIAIIFSYGVINFAMNIIKPKNNNTEIKNSDYITAFTVIVSLPLLNLGMIYGLNIAVDNREVYIVTLIFTAITGILLVYQSKKLNTKEDKRIEILKKYKSWLSERKKLIKESRELHIKIFNENNKYERAFEDGEIISEENKLYTGLRKFFNECEDFDVWSNNYIETEKNRLSQITLNKSTVGNKQNYKQSVRPSE